MVWKWSLAVLILVLGACEAKREALREDKAASENEPPAATVQNRDEPRDTQPFAVRRGNARAVVEDYVRAYNDKDVDRMTEFMHPDIRWVSVEGDQMITIARGRSELARDLATYFDSPRATRSRLRNWSQSGSYVAVTEIASWRDDAGQRQEQSALSVYQIQDGLIRRVWYYPAE